MLIESAIGYLGFTWPLGLLAAWLSPGAKGGWQWDYTCPNLLLLGYYATACMMLYDAYTYVFHKWMHENKTAFRLMHRKHHGKGNPLA
jgi:sterol desaturase/sphingolipid hydroxylase (fatty acid hydroxylase superfamily)